MAIAFDATSADTGGSSPRTYAHTCSGSDRIMFVTTNVNTGSAVTITVTYNGVSMTQLGSSTAGGGGTVFLHYLIAPATGTNNIVATRTSGAGNMISFASSYTGANQTGQPNVSGTGGPTTTASYSQSLTTTVDNCWSVMGGTKASALTLTGGANTTIRQDDTAFVGLFLCDSNGPKTPAGTATLNVTSGSQSFGSVMASFSPSYNIALDATTTSSLATATTTLTYSHTCSGSNRILIVATANNGLTNITGVTYNGVAMTQVASPLTNSNNSKLYLWILVNPSTGANNIVVTASGSCSIISKCISYTGASQTGQPDSSSSTGPTTSTSFTTSTTTVADNTWCVMGGMGMNGSTLTAGANTVVRSQIEVALAGLFMVDTGGPQTPAGSKSVNVTSASQQFHGIMISISPYVPAVTVNSNFLMFFM